MTLEELETEITERLDEYVAGGGKLTTGAFFRRKGEEICERCGLAACFPEASKGDDVVELARSVLGMDDEVDRFVTGWDIGRDGPFPDDMVTLGRKLAVKYGVGNW